MAGGMMGQFEEKLKNDHTVIQTYLDDKPFYTNQRSLDCEGERPERGGMLITITSGLCLFLLGVSLMIGSSKEDNFNASKHSAGVVILVLALLFFLLFVIMCVRDVKKVRERQHSRKSLILNQTYDGNQRLQISTGHVQEEMCKNSQNRLFLLPNILNEKLGNPKKLKETS